MLCDEMGFKMPFTKYEGKELVLWGSAKLVRDDKYQSLLSVSHKDRQQGRLNQFAWAEHVCIFAGTKNLHVELLLTSHKTVSKMIDCGQAVHAVHAVLQLVPSFRPCSAQQLRHNREALCMQAWTRA